jgi:hypothetical protein
MPKHAGGRPSIFRNKGGGARYQGVLTRHGSDAFERRRRELAAIAARPIRGVTDADVIEFLARGRENTVAYLAEATR